MENTEGSFRMGLVSRALAPGLAGLATSFIFTGVTLAFTAGAGASPAEPRLAGQAPAYVLPQA